MPNGWTLVAGENIIFEVLAAKAAGLALEYSIFDSTDQEDWTSDGNVRSGNLLVAWDSEHRRSSGPPDLNINWAEETARPVGDTSAVILAAKMQLHENGVDWLVKITATVSGSGNWQMRFKETLI